MLLRHANELRDQLESIKDKKVVILGKRYNLKRAKEEVDKTIDTIGQMKAKEKDKNGFAGIHNFPKLLLKLMLQYEYIYDYVTYWTLAAEIYPERLTG